MRPFCTIFAYLEVPSAVALLRNFDLEEQAQQLSDKRKYSAADLATLKKSPGGALPRLQIFNVPAWLCVCRMITHCEQQGTPG